MTAKNAVAVVLVAIGLVALAYQGVIYTQREKAVTIRSLEDTAETNDIPLPPIVGAAAICGGLILLITGKHS